MKHVILVFILLPILLFGQHAINGTFSPAEDYKVLILYKVTPKESLYVANTQLNEDGTFVIHLDSTFTPGMYRIVYALPQEDYNFDIIYNGKEDIQLSFNNETHVVFQKSFENTLLASYVHSMAMISNSINKYFSEKSSDTIALKAIFKTQQETQANFEEASKDMIALNFIKANRPYIPEQIEDVKTYVSHLKTHFFDHIDFNNEVLQSSKFLKERMFNYVYGIQHKGTDKEEGFKKNLDTFYNAMKDASTEIKSSLLLDMWQDMVDKSHDAVANYISESYLIALAEKLGETDLVNSLTQFKNTSIGNTAPDFSIENLDDVTKTQKKLSDLDTTENYIIVFWSSTCSHCLDEIPQLESFVKNQKPDKLKVVAIGLEDEPNDWKNTIVKYPNFIHVYGKNKWDNTIATRYNVHETPTYFILNKDKIIVSKPDSIEALISFLEN